ncbi:MAG: CoA transferase, partial [Burkholderiaceae bacterium]
FDAAGVPVGPVHSIGEALNHPQSRARKMVVDLEHPRAGKTKAVGCPLHFSKTPATVKRPAPLLGEHTREVLREFGYHDEEIDRWASEGVIATSGAPPR